MNIDEALYQLKQRIKMHELEGTTSNENEREKALLDCITNLQEENEKLKEQIKKDNHILGCNFASKDKYKQELEDYKSRNEKAIEFVNTHLYMESTCGIQHPTFDGKPSYDFNCFDLLDILNGGDEE